MIQAIGIGMRRYFGFKLSYRAEADIRNRLFTHIPADGVLVPRRDLDRVS